MGLGLVGFPIVSQTVYYLASHAKINEFKETAQKIDMTEINRRIELAQAYNQTLNNPSEKIEWHDPFSEEKKKSGREEYARMLEVNEQIGQVIIPKIKQELPIYAGTSEDVLQKGVGHLEGTSLPVGGENTHAVLTAHRGLPTARLFTDLDKVKVKDIFYVRNLKETLAYEVDQIEVIEPTNIDPLRLIPGQDRVTLLTCTPYMINSHRLLVHAKRIPYVPEKMDKEVEGTNNFDWYLIGGAVAVIVLLILWYLRKRRKKKKLKVGDRRA
ncbi:class C sortase [Atopobacter phocae]|uniref:class C sortase n=1 Tax=Atopobacter phocae TaxID=136492 RepID=UPI0004B1B751|nr:class C sortase [Atopobacter phocae]